MDTKMGTKEWRLYKYLREQATIDPNHWVSHEEICEALPDIFEMNHQAVSKMCCSRIQHYILRINANVEIEKIILYKQQKYKLAANAEEALEFIERKLLKRALRSFKRYWVLREKIESNGQGKLISNRDRAIDKHSHAREFVETFLNEALNSENELHEEFTVEDSFV